MDRAQENFLKKLLLLFALISITSFASLDWNIERLQSHLGYGEYSEVKELNSDEAWAILAYGFTDETDYQDMNGYLRHGSDYKLYNQTEKSVKKLIDDIISAAEKLPRMPVGLIAYRGFKLKWRNDKCFSTGEVISDKAFNSMTLNKKIANHFAFKKETGKGAFLTLELGSSKKGIMIIENDEDEVLLMPGLNIKITKSFEEEGKCFAEGLVE